MLDGGLSLEPMREGAKRWGLCALPIVHGFCPWQEVEGTSSMELCVFGFVEVSLAELYSHCQWRIQQEETAKLLVDRH
jgi:hypothetical protein